MMMTSFMTKPSSSLVSESLSFAYDSAPVLEDVNFSLSQGELIGLIGPNGAGKSTLLRLLLGLSQPDTGSISIMGQPLGDVKRRDLARQMTLVPQDAQINDAFSVEEVVAMGRNPWLSRFQPVGRKDLAIIRDAMEQTDVALLAKRPVNQLSGGERQRVLIARAIAQQTPIILLDEATANLDICHQLEVLELAKSLANQGKLVIAAIHDLAMAARFCDRLLLLADSRLQADDLPSAVITETNLARFFNLHAEVLLDSHQQLLIRPIAAIQGNG
ncbi:MAG: ABC transporter ATP-binding protein [Cellvibrionales bacterium]|nr:ABC transporter ATP-binding protein [Cellvibrionales bacterium]